MPSLVLRSAAAGVLCFVVLALAGRSGGSEEVAAGTAVRLDIAGLVEGAEWIFEGRVLERRVFEDPLTGRIDTEYLFEIERTFRGENQPVGSLRLPGGVLPDGRGLVIAGVPRLEVGEERLLFLSPPSGQVELRMPVGLSQGALRLERRFDGSKQLVREGIDVALVAGPGGAAASGARRIARDYAEVVAEIHAALAAQAARGSGR